MEMVTTEIAKGIVSDNYLTKEWYMQIYATINLSKQEMDEIEHLWRKQVFHKGAAFGQLFFKCLFSIYPELAFKFPELDGVADVEKTYANLWEKVLDAAKYLVASLDDVNILNHLCRQEKEKVKGFGFSGGDIYLMKEALIMTLEELIKKELSVQTKTAVAKVCKLIGNFVMNKDLDKI